jgi:hypothetical protein
VIASLVTAVLLTVVHADGRIGPFTIDVTTPAQVRAVLGKPDDVVAAIDEPTGRRIGSSLRYGVTWYAFSRETGRLSDFGTGSRAYVTEHGSRVGMTATAASAREHTPVVVRCGGADRTIHVRLAARRTLVLVVRRGHIASVAYLGSHRVSSEHC